MEFVVTSDGSKTLYHSGIGDHYHSMHGAVQESRHVFLQAGLCHLLNNKDIDPVTVLEVGFGTGLNFLLSANHCLQYGIGLHYTGVEAFPLPHEIIVQTGYIRYVTPTLWSSFSDRYVDCLTSPQLLATGIKLEIAEQPVINFDTPTKYDLLYFDAFASSRQPELWTEDSLRHVCRFIRKGGVFVTYAITGQLKRTLRGLGFSVEKLPGAPGKREMLRATKSSD